VTPPWLENSSLSERATAAINRLDALLKQEEQLSIDGNPAFAKIETANRIRQTKPAPSHTARRQRHGYDSIFGFRSRQADDYAEMIDLRTA
jgi:hypothetical protein